MIPQILLATLAAFGLATAAGLNGWATLFIVALLSRLGALELVAPFDVLGTDAVVVGLGIIMLIEGLADKVPGFDHASQLLHTLIQPAVGAILFVVQSNLITYISPELALFIGAFIAGSIHGIRATIRALLSISTGGMGNTSASLLEDVMAILITIASILAPLLMLIALTIGAVLTLRWWRERRLNSNGLPAASRKSFYSGS